MDCTPSKRFRCGIWSTSVAPLGNDSAFSFSIREHPCQYRHIHLSKEAAVNLPNALIPKVLDRRRWMGLGRFRRGRSRGINGRELDLNPSVDVLAKHVYNLPALRPGSEVEVGPG